jgi:DNA-binding IclR family transcriptional regulator
MPWLAHAGTRSEASSVGLRSASLGDAKIARVGIAETALPATQRIANRLHAAVSLAACDRLSMMIVSPAEAPTTPHPAMHVGTALPIATSALDAERSMAVALARPTLRIRE